MGAAHSLTLSHAVHIKYYLINWRTRYALLLKFVRTTIVYTILSVIGIFFSTANTKIGNENSGDYILAGTCYKSLKRYLCQLHPMTTKTNSLTILAWKRVVVNTKLDRVFFSSYYNIRRSSLVHNFNHIAPHRAILPRPIFSRG